MEGDHTILKSAVSPNRSQWLHLLLWIPAKRHNLLLDSLPISHLHSIFSNSPTLPFLPFFHHYYFYPFFFPNPKGTSSSHPPWFLLFPFIFLACCLILLFLIRILLFCFALCLSSVWLLWKCGKTEEFFESWKHLLSPLRKIGVSIFLVCLGFTIYVVGLS